MKTIRTTIAGTMALLLTGCVDTSRPPASVGQGELIVICELKPGVVETDVIPAANDLKRLPGVLDVIATGGLVRNRGGEQSSDQAKGIQIAFLISFKDTLASGEGHQRARKVFSDNGYSDKLQNLSIYDGAAQNYLISEEYTKETTAADLQRRTAAMEQMEQQRSRTK